MSPEIRTRLRVLLCCSYIINLDPNPDQVISYRIRIVRALRDWPRPCRIRRSALALVISPETSPESLNERRSTLLPTFTVRPCAELSLGFRVISRQTWNVEYVPQTLTEEERECSWEKPLIHGHQVRQWRW